ncbi:Peptidase A2 domain-containing protein, partial [Aphis craccivora]
CGVSHSSRSQLTRITPDYTIAKRSTLPSDQSIRATKQSSSRLTKQPSSHVIWSTQQVVFQYADSVPIAQDEDNVTVSRFRSIHEYKHYNRCRELRGVNVDGELQRRIPSGPYDSDDSRVGTDSRPRPFVTNRLRTRAFVSDTPDIPLTVQSVGTNTARPPSVATNDTFNDVVAAAAAVVSGTTNYATDQTVNNNTRDNTTDLHTNTHADGLLGTHTHARNDARTTNNNTNTINTENTSRMALALGEALRLIPYFDGTVPSDIFPFISACEIAMISVSDGCRPILLKAIKTKLRGNAYTITQYRDVEQWESLKTLLEEEFCVQRTAIHVQLELNATRQREGDQQLLNPYTNIVPRTLQRKCTIIIREHIKGQTLAIFIEGLRQPVKTIIKAGKPSLLELAIKESLEEERVYKSDKESQRFFSNSKPGRKTRYCNRCKTNTHHTENCRFIKGTQTGKTNHSSHTQVKSETESPTGGGERKKILLQLLQDSGISQKEKARERSTPVGTSGNDRRLSVKGEQTVRNLKLTAVAKESTLSQSDS